MSYSVPMYNRMISDRVRTDAYSRAMQAVIKPGSIVADIGTGSGYFAVLACRMGAARVYAIEPEPIIELARRVADHNGFSDTIVFIQAFSTHVTLDEKVDVVVCDLRDSLSLHEQIIPSIVDLRNRFLKPGGVLIPARDEIYGCLIHSDEFFSAVTEANAGQIEFPDLSRTRLMLRSTRIGRRTTPEECVSEYLHLGSVDFGSVVNPNFKSSVTWTADRAATAHGINVWFDTRLYADIGFSNSPASPDTVYGRSVYPLIQPVDFETGDVLTIGFEAVLVKGDYIFRWDIKVGAASDHTRVKTDLHQSSLDGMLMPREQLRRLRDDFIPPDTDKNRFVGFVLERVDGIRSLKAIAVELTRDFPIEFPSENDALQFTAEAVEKNR